MLSHIVRNSSGYREATVITLIISCWLDLCLYDELISCNIFFPQVTLLKLLTDQNNKSDWDDRYQRQGVRSHFQMVAIE